MTWKAGDMVAHDSYPNDRFEVWQVTGDHVSASSRWHTIDVDASELKSWFREPLLPIVIVIRDPDASNEFVVFDGEAEIYDVDAGGMDLDDDTEFLEWAGGHLQAAQDMEATRPEAADRIRDIVMGYLDYKHRNLGDLDRNQLLELAKAEGHI